MDYTFKALQLKARHQVYTLLSGNNLSKLHGEGYDFSQLRAYQRGDDIRKINWIISAKVGKPTIKELHPNRELSVVVATLIDGSLYFAKDNAKQQTMTEVATILGYATQQNGDLFQGICYTQNEQTLTPPTKQSYHIEQFSKMLYDASLLGTTLDFGGAIAHLFKSIFKPSLVFIVGDFLEEIDVSLLAQKHEVIAIIIRHKEEQKPTKLGEKMLYNPHTGQQEEHYVGNSAIATYQAKLHAHDATLQEHFLRYGVRSTTILTHEEVLPKLLRLFA